MTRTSLTCAIYTRKSSEDGLEQNFNSLHAQREACEAYVRSQQQEGWKLAPTAYDDGGYSGGSMARPALQRLLGDIGQKRIRIVVVYKVDRLTRSLADFATIVERFDALGVSFVSVTQQFNTTSSMGRLTLNVLLSFAQFEREVTGERIRDKIAASKKKGLWMGGFAPIGYRGNGRVLEVDESGAEQIRHIYERYQALRCVRSLKHELDGKGIVTPKRTVASGRVTGGVPFSRGQLYRILSHPVYRGMIVHADQVYPGQHLPIIEQETWDGVQAVLAQNRRGYQKKRSTPSQNLLVGKLFDAEGRRLIPSHSRKRNRQYRYYISEPLVTGTRNHSPEGLRLPAGELEGVVIQALLGWLADEQAVLDEIAPNPDAVQQTLSEAQTLAAALREEGEARFQCLQGTIDSVVVVAEAVTIGVRRDCLAAAPGSLRPASGDGEHPIMISVPVAVRRCGYSIRLLVPGNAPVATRDDRLIQVLRKAIEWQERLTSGKAKGVAQIAAEEKISTSHVTRMVYRSFLAPDIVKSIIDGTQPASLTSEMLKQCLPLPIDWTEQRALLGFEPT